MKTIKLISILLVLFLIFAAPTMRFNSIVPAPVSVPTTIKSIGLVDASITENKLKNVIEKGLSLELPGQDKVASQFALEGLQVFMNDNQRFSAIKTPKVYFNTSMKAIFPEPLSWDEIEILSRTYNVDAIAVLEFFDSDYNLLTNIAKVQMGFRLYDPSSRTIIDQHRFTHQLVWNPPVRNVPGVLNRALENNQAIQEVSFQMGEMYGRRIAPSWIRIEREYYRKSKGDDNLAIGARMMEANDWPSSISYLEKAVSTGHRKTKGRAAHNLAVVHEILGDFENAIYWAQQAWGVHKNKNSRHYSYELSQRKRDIEILRNQQKEN